jgi:ATP-dependent helicase/DNAse subunit B
VRGGAADPELVRLGEIEINDIRMRGKVDRVEIYHRGDEILFAVADYKTGKPPTRRDVIEGLSLQLMVYLEVIRRLLAQHFSLPVEQVRPVGGIYYRLNAQEIDTDSTYLFVPNEVKGKLSDGGIVEKNKSRYDPDTIDALQEMVDRTFNYSQEYVDGISSGIFPVTPHEVNRVCRGCDYQSTCRVSEVKIPG